MFTHVNSFVTDDDGAVTVDWVVLCAAVVGLTVLISTAMTTNAVGLGDSIADFMGSWTFN